MWKTMVFESGDLWETTNVRKYNIHIALIRNDIDQKEYSINVIIRDINNNPVSTHKFKTVANHHPYKWYKNIKKMIEKKFKYIA